MRKLFIFLLLLATLISCQKELNPDLIEHPKPTKELRVAATFDWKTTKSITLNILGFNGVNVSNILCINSSDSTIVYFKDWLNMGSDYMINFNVPSTETKVILTYGSKTQTIELSSNQITYDYISK